MTATELAAHVRQPARAQSILERTVCLVLTCGYLGNNRRVELAGLDVKKDGEDLEREKSEMRASKQLFSSRDLRAARAAIYAVKDRLRAMSVDGGTRIFGAGAYLIPLLGVEEAERAIVEGQALAKEKADDLARMLPKLKEQRKVKLGPLYREEEFPTADEIRAAFRIDYSYVSFATPEQLMEVDAAAYARAKARQDARLSAAYDDVVVGLRESAALVVRELAERLKPGEDGKPKALRPTALRDLQDLLGRLPVLNSVGEDGKLVDALAKVGALAEGLDVETLRKAPAVRGMLLETAEKVADQLDALVLSGRRAMQF